MYMLNTHPIIYKHVYCMSQFICTWHQHNSYQRSGLKQTSNFPSRPLLCLFWGQDGSFWWEAKYRQWVECLKQMGNAIFFFPLDAVRSKLNPSLFHHLKVMFTPTKVSHWSRISSVAQLLILLSEQLGKEGKCSLNHKTWILYVDSLQIPLNCMCFSIQKTATLFL